MLKTLAGIVAALFIGVLIYAATLPDTFRIERSTTIDAPPATVHPYINDFHRWTAWSPWEKKDPAMQRTHSGAPAGKGAVYAWDGNSDVGQGRMEIVESNEPSRVQIQLDFLKPFEAHNTAEFTLAPAGSGTLVTWSMHGPAPYLSKLMQVFVSMDRMVGPDFEAGLANLKRVAEQRQ
ncbi:SRPBCC family protein [Schlegelella sp. S2-27]|uniref:SRPBCC family protein n=1 Tax=Caldimonas mangrovi TaxID=2944811 RepID=A0ABT0YLZ0_9BURK|nr:SRPBCC family protein [Caldimonas mangrovi]MCM5679746.1 SRPBCC family protein [Caldimonas mangrovi]